MNSYIAKGINVSCRTIESEAFIFNQETRLLLKLDEVDNTSMNQNIIKKIQKQIIQLLPVDRKNQPGILLADSCSEVSRLVASWIKILEKSNHILILKGIHVCDTQKAHDILAVITVNNQVYIIDPTIWQFFPQAKSILVFILEDISVALDKIKIMYGGQWSKSEKFIQLDKNEEKKYFDIISQNIHENLKQLNLDSK